MPILSITTSQSGTVGVFPSISYINTNDTVAEVTTSGYLNNSIKSGMASFSLPCLCVVSTVASAGAQAVCALYDLSYVSGNWDLTVAGGSGSGTAAAKAATNNSLPDVASTSGSGFVVNNLVSASDPAGTIQDSGVNLQLANISITSTQFNAMFATPIPLISAPGAGKIIIVHSMVLSMTYGSVAYTNASGTDVTAQYGTGALSNLTQATTTQEVSDFFTTANTIYQFTGVNGQISDTGIPTSSAANQGLYLNVDSTFASGNSNFVARILYSVISV